MHSYCLCEETESNESIEFDLAKESFMPIVSGRVVYIPETNFSMQQMLSCYLEQLKHVVALQRTTQ